MKRKLRMGMVGGGKDAFIGAIHRIAANSDGLIELVCGALSINKDIAVDSGRSLFLPENRTYLTYDEMIEKAQVALAPAGDILAIKWNGYNKVKNTHHYGSRLQTLLEHYL